MIFANDEIRAGCPKLGHTTLLHTGSCNEKQTDLANIFVFF